MVIEFYYPLEGCRRSEAVLNKIVSNERTTEVLHRAGTLRSVRSAKSCCFVSSTSEMHSRTTLNPLLINALRCCHTESFEHRMHFRYDVLMEMKSKGKAVQHARKLCVHGLLDACWVRFQIIDTTE